MNLKSVFIGVPQSKYAGVAVLLALIAASVSILFGKYEMPLVQKIGAILLLVVVSIPGILFSLFQVTCITSGAGSRNQRWWCSTYAWIISVLVILYSVLLVAVATMSVFSNSKVINDLTMHNVENFDDSMALANQMAADMLTGGGSVNLAEIERNAAGNADNAAGNAAGNADNVANGETGKYETFEGNKLDDRDSKRSKVLGGSDTPYPFPYTDGTLNPLHREPFANSKCEMNNGKPRCHA
jgi:hypothetical protein